MLNLSYPFKNKSKLTSTKNIHHKKNKLNLNISQNNPVLQPTKNVNFVNILSVKNTIKR